MPAMVDMLAVHQVKSWVRHTIFAQSISLSPW